MLKRKVESVIRNYFTNPGNKILVVEGARQIGKSYIIRHVGQQCFSNYIEINFAEDAIGERNFENVRTVGDFYLQISMIAGERLQGRDDTLIFLDEIQEYPHFLTMLKFLKQDDRYTYIASGSLLGVTLRKTSSIPIGSIELLRMYPLDFEEFLYANGFGRDAIEALRSKYLSMEMPDQAMHHRLLDLFKKYLLSGGMPDAVNAFVGDNNIYNVRTIQRDIRTFYADDASKYESENGKKLKIRTIYEMIPSNMENKKKRVIAQEIEGIKGRRFSDYRDEFEYLISSGIALEVKAISTPVFPLTQASKKNLLKLYLNDVGLLSGLLYENNIRAILDHDSGVNLGAVYETVIAQELCAHGHSLCYYDNRTRGEVDFLLDNYDELSVMPIEVKSGKDYTIHSALNTFLNNEDYHIKKGIVLSNAGERRRNGKVIYLPVYDVMFL